MQLIIERKYLFSFQTFPIRGKKYIKNVDKNDYQPFWNKFTFLKKLTFSKNYV